MNSRHCPGLAIISGKHVLVFAYQTRPVVMSVKRYFPRRAEIVLTVQTENRRPLCRRRRGHDRIGLPGMSGRTVSFVMSVICTGIRSIAGRDAVVLSVLRSFSIPFTRSRIALICAFLDDLHHLPRFQSDIVHADKTIVRGICRVDGPAQSVRVAKSVGRDVLLCSRH